MWSSTNSFIEVKFYLTKSGPKTAFSFLRPDPLRLSLLTNYSSFYFLIFSLLLSQHTASQSRIRHRKFATDIIVPHPQPSSLPAPPNITSSSHSLTLLYPDFRLHSLQKVSCQDMQESTDTQTMTYFPHTGHQRQPHDYTPTEPPCNNAQASPSQLYTTPLAAKQSFFKLFLCHAHPSNPLNLCLLPALSASQLMEQNTVRHIHTDGRAIHNHIARLKIQVEKGHIITLMI